MHVMPKQIEYFAKAFAIVTVGLFVALANPSFGWSGEAVNTGYFGNVAIKGYDPVAYYTDGKATPGREAISYKWLGAHWRFANDEHRRLFTESLTSYMPQYGGFCASGMGIHGGRTSDIDPEAWQIIDGKLYLNYSQETNTLITEGIVDLNKADANWAASAKAEQ